MSRVFVNFVFRVGLQVANGLYQILIGIDNDEFIDAFIAQNRVDDRLVLARLAGESIDNDVFSGRRVDIQ